MRAAFLLLLVFAALAAAGCDTAGDAPREPTEIRLSDADRAVIQQSNAFGVGLFARVAADEPDNLMLSPLSASVALTMLLNGTDGTTYDQIHTMLGYAPGQSLAAVNASYQSLVSQLLTADDAVELAIANAVFYDSTYQADFVPSFFDTMADAFSARVEALDFTAPSAVGAVNGWASEHTNGRIPRVLDQIDSGLVLFLMNAVYFKGDWTTQFSPARTAPGAFRTAAGTTVQVPMMHGSIPSLMVAGDGYQALEMPYGRGNFSMVVVLPDTTLPVFAERLAGGLWDEITAGLDSRESAWTALDVTLPKFTFSFERWLNDDLRALGMTDAFEPDLANLSRMGSGLFVNFVKQNTFVDVNEEGTEAAAVTTVGVGIVSAPPSFVANRPFVFAVRERTTHTLLFLGQVAQP